MTSGVGILLFAAIVALGVLLVIALAILAALLTLIRGRDNASD